MIHFVGTPLVRLALGLELRSRVCAGTCDGLVAFAGSLMLAQQALVVTFDPICILHVCVAVSARYAVLLAPTAVLLGANFE